MSFISNSVHNFATDFDIQHNLSNPVQTTTLPANSNSWGGKI